MLNADRPVQPEVDVFAGEAAARQRLDDLRPLPVDSKAASSSARPGTIGRGRDVHTAEDPGIGVPEGQVRVVLPGRVGLGGGIGVDSRCERTPAGHGGSSHTLSPWSVLWMMSTVPLPPSTR